MLVTTRKRLQCLEIKTPSGEKILVQFVRWANGGAVLGVIADKSITITRIDRPEQLSEWKEILDEEAQKRGQSNHNVRFKVNHEKK